MIEELIYEGNLEAIKSKFRTEGAEAVKCNEEENKLASIHFASKCGDIEIIKFLTSPPISEDPNLKRKNDFTALHGAAMNGHDDVVKLLIQLGANIDAQTDPQKYAPVHSAAFGGHLSTLKILLSKKASLKLKNYRNELPIDTAKRQNQMEVYDYLKGLKK